MDRVERSALRLSDAERERAVEHLRSCTAEGRLSLDEFTDRVDAVYTAKTYGELDVLLADLPDLGLRPPTATPVPVTDSVVHLEAASSVLRRDGDWLVPPRLSVETIGASVRLDFSRARIDHAQVDVELDVVSSSVKLLLPPDGWAEDTAELVGASLRNRARREPGSTGVRFTVRGLVQHSSVVVKRRRR